MMPPASSPAPAMGLEADPLYGEIIAHYPSDRWRLLVLGGITGLASAIALNFTTATIPGWVGPALTIVLMASITLAMGWYALHVWNREIVLHTRGFSAREGKNTVYFFYDEVRGVRLRAERLAYLGGLIRRPVYVTTIMSVRDEVLIVDGTYKRAGEFGAAFLRLAAPALRARIDATLERGDAVTFGGLSVTAAGFHHRGDVLSWAACRGCRAAAGHLHILDQTGAVWASAPLREVDNLPLLIDLIRERTGSGKMGS